MRFPSRAEPELPFALFGEVARSFAIGRQSYLESLSFVPSECGALFDRKIMALPHVAKNTSYSTDDLYYFRWGAVQAKPYSDPLSCDVTIGRVLSGRYNRDLTIRPSWVAYGQTDWRNAHNTDISRCSNKAREGFSQACQSRVNTAVDLAEYHQSLQMIASRATQIAGIVRAVRKKDFGALLNNLDPRGSKAIRGRRPTWKKSFANNFLETHFGWVPLCQDIHDAAQAISQPLKSTKVVKSASERFSNELHSGTPPYYRNFGTYGTVKVRVSAYVKCTNPALHLASNLGLTNPAALAWELIPFSFVVDWFANVGQFVGQLDEFAGLELIHPVTTIFCTQSGWQQSGNPEWLPPNQSTQWSNTWLNRALGIPPVRLVSNKLKLPSPTRALTAISLLIQQLGK